MFFNLTERQKELARFLVRETRGHKLPESFHVYEGMTAGRLLLPDLKIPGTPEGSSPEVEASLGEFDALSDAKLLIQRINYETAIDSWGSKTTERHTQSEKSRVCTLLGLIYKAVDTEFAETTSVAHAADVRQHTSHIRDTAFIMMWMDKKHPELDDVSNAIKDVCVEFGIKAVRADDIEHQDRITDVVLQQISRSEFLIADMTGERPNVYYEVGYAHALGKRPILYRKENTPLHFDLSVHNVPPYSNLTHLKDLLRKRFEALLGRPPQSGEK